VTIKLSTATPRARHPIRVAGYVYPKEPGDAVELQYETAAGWRTVQSDRTYSVDTNPLRLRVHPQGATEAHPAPRRPARRWAAPAERERRPHAAPR
jgi:hypothetical protein